MSQLLNQPVADDSLVACPNCDLVQRLPALGVEQSARCSRCDTELWRRRADSLNRTLALAIASTVLCVIVNAVPMLGLTAVGRKSFTTVFGGAELLWEHGMHVVSVVVFFTAVLAPALQIGFILLIVIGARQNRPPFWVGALLKYLPFTRLWSMLEVMLLGVLVSLTKIAEYATVIPGHALFAVGGLVVLLAVMQSSFDSREVWLRVEWAQEREREVSAAAPTVEAGA